MRWKPILPPSPGMDKRQITRQSAHISRGPHKAKKKEKKKIKKKKKGKLLPGNQRFIKNRVFHHHLQKFFLKA
jgi:hypothetical protein